MLKIYIEEEKKEKKGKKNRKLKKLLICVRTDFRTSREEEIGINGIFNLADRVIYMPAYVNSLEEVEQFYKSLAKEI